VHAREQCTNQNTTYQIDLVKSAMSRILHLQANSLAFWGEVDHRHEGLGLPASELAQTSRCSMVALALFILPASRCRHVRASWWLWACSGADAAVLRIVGIFPAL